MLHPGDSHPTLSWAAVACSTFPADLHHKYSSPSDPSSVKLYFVIQRRSGT